MSTWARAEPVTASIIPGLFDLDGGFVLGFLRSYYSQKSLTLYFYFTFTFFYLYVWGQVSMNSIQ